MAFAIQGLDTLFVGGEQLPPGGGVAEVVNPATEEIVGLSPVADLADVDAAVAAARHAFDLGPWPRMPAVQRGAALMRFHDAIAARIDQLAEIVRLETGAVLSDVRPRQIELPMRHFRHAVQTGQRNFNRTLNPTVTSMGERQVLGTATVKRVPVGVVAAITAYNYPTYLNLAKLGPALIAGNTVVLKPSEFTPFQALLLADAAREANLPAGVLNIVNGGIVVGEALTTDPRVDLVSFTGSDIVGAKIAGQSAPTLKRVLLELGGKSAMIVRPDGDQAMAAAGLLRGFTAHAGQGCGMFTRFIVHNSIRADLVARVAEAAKAIKVGDTADPSVQMGPVIRASQRDRVERYVAIGRESGARLVVGGQRPAGLDRGFFFEPTLFDDVDNGSAIAQDEIFGPVGIVMGYDTDEEAIALANDSPFGLRAGILSANVGRAFEMADQLQAGHILINGGALTALSEVPFGGVKRSGYGREGGDEGYFAYTEPRAIEFHAG